MIQLDLVRISEDILWYKGISKIVYKRTSTHIAGQKIIGNIPDLFIRRMQKLPYKINVVIVNEPLLFAPADHIFNKKRFSPYGVIWRDGTGVTYLPLADVLVEGNYFLCISVTEKAFLPYHTLTEDEKSGLQYAKKRSYTDEFAYHTNIEGTRTYRTKCPAYVNLDRTSESIGSSAWDGNLTRWFEAGYTTRVQYASQSGLLPEEDAPHG